MSKWTGVAGSLLSGIGGALSSFCDYYPWTSHKIDFPLGYYYEPNDFNSTSLVQVENGYDWQGKAPFGFENNDTRAVDEVTGIFIPNIDWYASAETVDNQIESGGMAAVEHDVGINYCLEPNQNGVWTTNELMSHAITGIFMSDLESYRVKGMKIQGTISPPPPRLPVSVYDVYSDREPVKAYYELYVDHVSAAKYDGVNKRIRDSDGLYAKSSRTLSQLYTALANTVGTNEAAWYWFRGLPVSAINVPNFTDNGTLIGNWLTAMGDVSNINQVESKEQLSNYFQVIMGSHQSTDTSRDYTWAALHNAFPFNNVDQESYNCTSLFVMSARSTFNGDAAQYTADGKQGHVKMHVTVDVNSIKNKDDNRFRNLTWA